MNEHGYCRSYLASVMEDVRKLVSPDIIKSAWGYKYSDGQMVEFHVPPDDFYWYGRGCCKWMAKADGWMAYLAKKGLVGG